MQASQTWSDANITNMMFVRPLHYGKKQAEIIIVTGYEIGKGNKDERTPSR
jgi:hypothetical protein